MSYWESNINALRQEHPDLYRQISSHNVVQVGEIIETPSGLPTLRFNAPNGRPVLAYGLENPWEDASVHLRTVQEDTRNLALFIGMGLGYGPLLVYRKRPQLGMLVILEPSLDLFCTAMRHVDLTPLFVDKKVRFLVGEISMAQLESMIARIASLEDIHLLRHVPSFEWQAELYKTLDHNAFMLVNQLNASGSTTRKCRTLFTQNRMANLTLLSGSSSLDATRDLFAGKPAVLVAAGPSLDQSLEDLKKVKGHCVLFAVDSALAPLLNAGIEPDFVTAIDYLNLNFEKVAPFFNRTWSFSLITTPKVTPLIPKRFPARHRFLAFYEDLPHMWVVRSLGLRVLVPPAFSVAHLSLGIALSMGCDPIFLVGQDLAFTSVDADHAIGTVIMRNGLPTDREIYQVPDIAGGKVPTDRGLMSLQKKFEDIIKGCPRRYFNSSAAGVRIAGTEVMPLAEASARYMAAPLAVTGMVDETLGKSQGFAVSDFIKDGRQTLSLVNRMREIHREVTTLTVEILIKAKKIFFNKHSIREFRNLPGSLTRKLHRFEELNRFLDQEGQVSEHLLEINYESLSKDDQAVAENREIREKQGYLPWLIAEVKRIEAVNQSRGEAYAFYEEHLGRLVVHLEEEDRLHNSGSESAQKAMKLLRLYLASGDLCRAQEILSGIDGGWQRDPEVLVMAGDLYAGLLDFNAAQNCWRQALALAPSRALDIERLREKHLAFWAAMIDEFGNVGEEGDNFSKLLPDWMARIAVLMVENTPAPDFLRQLWEKHAVCLDKWLASGRLDLVDEALKGWKLLTTWIPAIQVVQARLAGLRQQQDVAVELLEKAIVRQPDNAPWLALLARNLLECGRFDEGVSRLREAVAMDPGQAGLWEEIGDALTAEGDINGAVMAYEYCFVALPDCFEALRKMGDCYLRIGQLQAAIAAYEAVLGRDPDNSAARAKRELARTMQDR